MLLGEPGIGKSSWVEALGDTLHTKVFVLPCNQLADKADLTGARLIPTANKDDYKQTFYPHAIISDAIAYAEANPRETPILFMDELNRTTPDVTSEALSLPTQRRIGSKALPKNLKIITAGNDKGNITSLDEASISRFVLFHVAPDVQTFLNLYDDLNPFIRTVLEHHPETIFCKGISIGLKNTDDDDNDDYTMTEEILDDGDDMFQITTPRTIHALSRFLNKFSNDQLLQFIGETQVINGEEVSLLQGILEGFTGKTTFTAFLLGEMAAGLMAVNNQQNTLSIPKPKSFDTLKACASIDELNDTIEGMTENERSGCFVYAIYEKANNSAILNALMNHVSILTQTDLKNLAKASMANMLDEDNKNIVLNSSSDIAKTLQTILMMS